MDSIRKRIEAMQQFQPIPLKNKLRAGGMTACMGKRPKSDNFDGWVRLSEVLKLLATLRAPGWRPISEAPRGKEVLVWREDSGPFIAKLTTPEEVISTEEMDREGLEFPEGYEEWWSDAYGWQEGDEKPTHFMPLPPPPEKE